MPHRRFTARHAALVVWTMGWADFTARYHGSVLGYLWSFSLPMAKLLVLFYVFHPLLGTNIQRYPLYLFLGLIVWEHFALLTSKCLTALRDKRGLVQRVSFPRILLILAAGVTSGCVALTYVAVYLAVAVALRVPLDGALLYVPVMLAQTTVLGMGVGAGLAAYSLRFPDLEHLWQVGLQILFWLTPVIYPHALRGPLAAEAGALLEGGQLQSLAWTVTSFVRLQPLSLIIHDARRSLLYVADAGIPSVAHVLGVTGILLLVFAAGAFAFIRRSKHFFQEY